MTGDADRGAEHTGPLSALRGASRWLAWAAGAAMLLASVWITVDVVLRRVWGVSLEGSIEISGYVLALGSSWAFAYALFGKAHVRVDTLYGLMPRRLRPWLDLLALGTLGFVIAMLCRHAVELTTVSYEFGSRTQLQLPLWIPQAIWTFGLVFFGLTIIALFISVVRALLRRDVQQALSLASVESVQDELEQELESARRRQDR